MQGLIIRNVLKKFKTILYYKQQKEVSMKEGNIDTKFNILIRCYPIVCSNT